jgi:hypothetical protein
MTVSSATTLPRKFTTGAAFVNIPKTYAMQTDALRCAVHAITRIAAT